MNTADKKRQAARVRVRRFREKRRQFDIQDVRIPMSKTERLLLRILAERHQYTPAEYVRLVLTDTGVCQKITLEKLQTMLLEGADSDQICAHFNANKADQDSEHHS
jgi:hypothetical protein